MMTVNEVSKLSGVSVRTLHHYDSIGLLKPASVTEAGYRLYGDAQLERLHLILAFREIGFPLKEIQAMLDAPDYDRNQILDRQIAFLQKKIEHLQNRIHFASGMKQMGVTQMNWSKFDSRQLDDYSKQAETLYGKTEAYQEFREKSSSRSKEQEQDLGSRLMEHFAQLGQMKDLPPESEPVQTWVAGLQAFISQNYYTCTNEILQGLGQMYACGGSMTENIDKAGGCGTGAFAMEAINFYCKK